MLAAVFVGMYLGVDTIYYRDRPATDLSDVDESHTSRGFRMTFGEPFMSNALTDVAPDELLANRNIGVRERPNQGFPRGAVTARVPLELRKSHLISV